MDVQDPLQPVFVYIYEDAGKHYLLLQLVQCPAWAVILYSYYKHNRAKKKKSNKKKVSDMLLLP